MEKFKCVFCADSAVTCYLGSFLCTSCLVSKSGQVRVIREGDEEFKREHKRFFEECCAKAPRRPKKDPRKYEKLWHRPVLMYYKFYPNFN